MISLLRSAPAPLRIAAIVMGCVALGYAVTSLVAFLRHDSTSTVVTAAWLGGFAVVNAGLAWLMVRAVTWARIGTLVLYTLSVVRDAAAFFAGTATLSNALSLIVAGAVIVLLAGFASVTQFFAPDPEGLEERRSTIDGESPG